MPQKKPNPEPPDFDAYHPADPLEAKWNLFNAAAKKDLHWWFFALLMIGMGYVGFERWESGKEREALRAEILDVRTSQLAYVTSKNDAMMAALLNNTRALEANTQTLNRIENRKNNE